MKKCTKCGEVKPLELFCKSKNTKSGYAGHCISCENERTRASYRKHKERKLAQNKAWSESNKDHHRKLQYRWRDENPDKVIESRRKGAKNKLIRHYEYLNENPLAKLKIRLRTRTYIAFRSQGFSKNTKTAKMLGCSWEVAKSHLERQFEKGMTWENMGDWHIDHIIPLASANTEKELIRLCHYTNLQPLWAQDNLKKKDSIPEVQLKIAI